MVFLKKKAAKNFSKSFENICEGAQNSNFRNCIPATCFMFYIGHIWKCWHIWQFQKAAL